MQVLPYYHWRRYPCQGKVIQLNEESIRRTLKSPKPSARKVFMFGGSTMWGTGSPDAYTIPSQLQALLGDDYDVYNFGETAFVSTQQLYLLLEQLSKRFIPDIVIFYDGVNDTYANLYSPGKVRHPQFGPEDYTSKSETSYLLLKIIEKTNYIAITERLKLRLKKDDLSKWESNIGPNLTLKVGDALTQYQALMKQVSALGNAYGFSTYHFWQPMLLTEKRTLTDYEQNIYKAQTDALIQSYRAMYDAAHKLDGKNHFYFIADVFNEANQPIYFDFCHVGPKGNELVARKMYEIAFNQNQNQEAGRTDSNYELPL